MKKAIITLFLYTIGALFFAVSVSAHTLKIDGNIGVNLHVDPDDAPVAGGESKFLLDIQDKSGRFNPNNPNNCDCILTIMQNDMVLKQLPVVAGGTFAQLRYTFPTSDVYKVIVEGKPRGEGVPFQSFRTEFEYFVKSEAGDMSTVQTDQNALATYAPFVALGVGLLIILLFVL